MAARLPPLEGFTAAGLALAWAAKPSRRLAMLRPVLLALLLLALNGPSAAQGLKLQREAETPLRARVHLLSGDQVGQKWTSVLG